MGLRPDRVTPWAMVFLATNSAGAQQRQAKRGSAAFVLYEVPRGRAFVVTDVYRGDAAIILHEELGSAATLNLQIGGNAPSTSFSSPVGIVFRPGSRTLSERMT